ncbi:Solute carrier family 35 member C2 [Trichinella nelsoni]|uniref:Solute carrier family 35 member C2 n=1 Tax=Trichinella nelsoni TaxID=6336 RepID=A0A0V0S3L5_9BILA|nr:Solute carrier family 35 member C2 [Trichinella nelsoni]
MTERAVYFVNYGVIHSWMKMGISNCSSRLLESDLIKALLAGILYYPTSLALTFYQQWVIKQSCYLPGNRAYCIPISFVHRTLALFFEIFCRLVLSSNLRLHLPQKAGSTPMVEVRHCSRHCWRQRIVGYWPVELELRIHQHISVRFRLLILCLRFEFSVIQWANRRRSFSSSLQPLRCRWRNVYNASTVSVVCLIAVGVFFVNYKSTQFSWTGFFLIQGASMCGGLRWAASQKLLQKEILGLSNPFDMIYHVQPWMVVGILPLFFAFEARDLALISTTAYGSKPSSVLRLSALVLIGGLLATLMEVFEYLLLLYTSSLTLSVCSVGKELVTLLLAYRYRNDRMSLVNAFGLAMCIFGTALHVTMRTKRLRDPKAPQLTRPTVVYTELRDRQYAALSEASSTDSEEF